MKKLSPFTWKLFVLVGLLVTTSSLAAQGVFRLESSHKNADINYLTIKNINSLEHGYKAMFKAFQPVKGQYQVYIFIKEFIGPGKYFGDMPMHDLIILKTNKEHKILDGFYYRLEWSEVPSQSMIFRINTTDMALLKNLKVVDLIFYNEYESWGKALDEMVKLEWCKQDIIKL